MNMQDSKLGEFAEEFENVKDLCLRLGAENEALKEHQKMLTVCVSLLADHGDKVKGSKDLFAMAKKIVADSPGPS